MNLFCFGADVNLRKHLLITCIYAYPLKFDSVAITNLGFFLAALIKPIHADLLLINFVRRKGRVCIFARRVSPHFKGFVSEPERRETPAALEQTLTALPFVTTATACHNLTILSDYRKVAQK